MTNEAPPTLDDAKLKSFVLQYSDLSFEKIIGSGANGDVYIGTHIPSKKRVAIKRLHDSETITQNDLPFRREIYTLSIIKNQFLLPFVGFTKTSPFCIVTKFIPGGSLYSNLRKENDEEDTKKKSKEKITLKSKSKSNSNYLNPTDLTIIAFCIAKGMKYLHKINIIHRDLKTQNILLDEKKLPIICDFGTSRRFDILSNSKPAMTGQCGTPNYMAPEFIKNESYDQSVDVYSYGVILWEMLTRETPYGGKDAPQVIYMILSNKMLEIPEDTPENLKKLILSCWDVDSSHRPSFSQIVKMFNRGEILFEGTNKKHFDKTIQLFSDERKGSRPRQKSSSCEFQQTPVLNYIPSGGSINNNNTNQKGTANNNNNNNIHNQGIKRISRSKMTSTNINNNFIQFNDEDEIEDEKSSNDNDDSKNLEISPNDEDIRQQPQIDWNFNKNTTDRNENQQRPKIPKKAILSIEQRKSIAFRKHIAQLTTLYIRGIETGTDQQIRNSIAFIESHANDPALAKVEIWPKLLPVICNSISSRPGIVPALQTLSLRLAESPAVLASISTVQELHRFLRPETFDLFLYVCNFVPQAVTVQMVKTLFTYSLPQQHQMQQHIEMLQQQQAENMHIAQQSQQSKNVNSYSLSDKNKYITKYSTENLFPDPFMNPPNAYDDQWQPPFPQSKIASSSNEKINFSSSNEDFAKYGNGGFGSFQQKSILESTSNDFFPNPISAQKSRSTINDINNSSENNNNNNNSSENNNNNNNNGKSNQVTSSGPSSMQIMSSQLSATEKATILLCVIHGQFQNNYNISNRIINFFVENAVKFANVAGGHLVLRTLLNNGLVTEDMFTSFSQSIIPENIIALYSCIFSINSNQNDSQISISKKGTKSNKQANYVPNYFTLSQILEHMLSIYPRLRSCAYEFIYRHGDHAANKPLLNITETLLKSIMMYHPNGTERAILLLCRIACDSSSNRILITDKVAPSWLVKMSPITAPPLMRLFVILFKDEKLRSKMITSPQNEMSSNPHSSLSQSPSISSSSSNAKHIHKYFENIAASNSHSGIKTKKGNGFLDDIQEVKLNRMSALFLSNVVKNGDNQAFLTVCWVFSHAQLNNEFVSIIEDCEVTKIIAEKFNATKNVYALRIICAALIQISKGFLTYESARKLQKAAAKHKTSSRRSHMAKKFVYPNDQLLKGCNSDLAFENLPGTSSSLNNSSNCSLLASDSYTSEASSLFSLSTSSPSFSSFNDGNEPEPSTTLTSYSSANTPRLFSNLNNEEPNEYIPVLKKCSDSFNKIVLTCLKLITERNEASKECILLLASLSMHKETHETLIHANCIGVLSSFGSSGELVQPYKTIISQLKASGTIKNF